VRDAGLIASLLVGIVKSEYMIAKLIGGQFAFCCVNQRDRHYQSRYQACLDIVSEGHDLALSGCMLMLCSTIKLPAGSNDCIL
jgi:hypothetical protein